MRYSNSQKKKKVIAVNKGENIFTYYRAKLFIVIVLLHIKFQKPVENFS